MGIQHVCDANNLTCGSLNSIERINLDSMTSTLTIHLKIRKFNLRDYQRKKNFFFLNKVNVDFGKTFLCLAFQFL